MIEKWAPSLGLELGEPTTHVPMKSTVECSVIKLPHRTLTEGARMTVLLASRLTALDLTKQENVLVRLYLN